jgi:hypothetical protein
MGNDGFVKLYSVIPSFERFLICGGVIKPEIDDFNPFDLLCLASSSSLVLIEVQKLLFQSMQQLI